LVEDEDEGALEELGSEAPRAEDVSVEPEPTVN
jgi:hypothetical protein